MLEKATDDVNELGGAANDYLHVFGYTAMAFGWAKMAEVSLAKLAEYELFHQSKIHTARYYFSRLLPRRHSLTITASAGAEHLFNMQDDWF